MATNYTTKTASLKATTADIRILNAKNITAESISIVNGDTTTNVSTALTSLDERIDAIENIQVNGVISDVTASTAARDAGITVVTPTVEGTDGTENTTVREISVTTGEIKAGETKVVTGDAVNTAITTVKTVADTAVQTASGDTYVSAEKETNSTNIKVSTNIEAIDAELAKEPSKVGKAIKDAQDTANAAVKTVAKPTEGASALLTVDQQGTAVTINLSSEVATKGDITTAIGNAKVVVEKGTGINVTTSDNLTYTVAVDETIATKAEVTAAQTAAEGKVTTLQDTAITSQSVSGAGISVTLAGKVGAPTLTGSVTTASYTPATETTAGSWANEANVATASDVKAAIADVATKHTADIEKVEAAIESLSTSGFSREIVTELPTTGIKLNAIYLVANKESDANEYIEYIYVGGTVIDGQVRGGRFEEIGTTKTDLSEYAKTADVNAALALKANSADVYTKTEIDTAQEATDAAIATKADQTALDATNIEVAKKANSADVYTKTEIDSQVTTINSAIEAAAAKGQQGIDDAAAAQADADAAQGAADAAQAAADAAQDTADAKIAEVEVTTDAETHFGAQHISAETNDDKKVTISVTRSNEWSVGADKPATDITSVINGKMSGGSTSSTIDDANLINGTSMFAGNTSLTTYIGDLSKLTNGTGMFNGCSALTTFVGDLGSLTDGTDMFTGCKLTEESLIYIVDSLPAFTPETPLAHRIDVTVGNGVDVSSYEAEAAEKGWKLGWSLYLA